MHKEKYHSYRKHFVASDLHFNHKNISLYCPESRGQFVECTGQSTDVNGVTTPTYNFLVDKMNETIIERWNSKVQPGDHVFILGDVAMGRIELAPALIKRLNGDKTLILGNHDRGLMKLPEVDELFIDIRDYTFLSVRGVGVAMSHYPMLSWDGMGHSSIMLHGHLHGSPYITPMTGRRIKDIGIDTNDLYPYDLEAVVNEINQLPKMVFDHHSRSVG